MFRIRQAQMAGFAAQARAAFHAKMLGYLREAFATWVAELDDAALGAWLDEAIERCDRFDVTTEPEAAQLVLLLLVLGLDVEQRHRFAAPILTHRTLLPIGKVRALAKAARAHGIERIDEVLVFREMSLPPSRPVEATP